MRPTSQSGESTSSHPLKIFDAAKKQNKFLYACAPMVRYSKLAFRQTVHKYGVDLCWTPMILAKEFNRNSFARDSDLTISTEGIQAPTVIQFGANSALELSRASSLAAPFVNGVDLNCGCPQSWACSETLGAALMDQRELVRDMVKETRHRLASDGWGVNKDFDMENPKGRSVSVKIRVHDDLRKTVDFLDTVIGHAQDRQVDWITIHPRTRHQASTVPIRLEALDLLISKYGKTVPILLSGDVFDLRSLPVSPSDSMKPQNSSSLAQFEDNSASVAESNGSYSRIIMPTPQNTNLAGFMSARGLLCNPALFAGYTSTPWEAVETFMCNVVRCPLPLKLVVHHVQEMCGPGMGSDKTALLSKKERNKLIQFTNMIQLLDFLDEKIAEKTGRSEGLKRYL